MKKIVTVASFVAISILSMSAPFSAFATDVVSVRIKPADGVVKHKSGAVEKKYRYLDMVEKKRSPSIRNAVIVYNFGMRKVHCNANDAKSVSECLREPST